MQDVLFPVSEITFEGIRLCTGRLGGRDVIVALGGAIPAGLGVAGGEAWGEGTMYPASYENVLAWEHRLAPARRLVAVNRSGHRRGFGAGNRIVVAAADVPLLREPAALGGWDGIYRALRKSAVPFWFVQQSIVRELIPEGIDPREHPGMGHTGGYGPRELLRAGLFALASLGGYAQSLPPIGYHYLQIFAYVPMMVAFAAPL
ncbi:MAG: hypothetical protein QME94_06860, partial [Anaerolineae bacterium]|nr:hypothetical protein [Anaerolineae bacterium]